MNNIKRFLVDCEYRVCPANQTATALQVYDGLQPTELTLTVPTYLKLTDRINSTARLILDRIRLSHIDRGASMLEQLGAATALRPTSFSMTFDRLTREAIVTFQFHDMLPMAIRLGVTEVRDLYAEFIKLSLFALQ